MAVVKGYRGLSKAINTLIVILFFKILAFSAFSETPIIAQGLKIVIGLTATGSLFLFFNRLISSGVIASFKYRFVLSYFFYMLFLIQGFASLLWSSDVIFSTIQILRYADLFVFSVLFIKVYRMLEEYYGDRIVPVSHLIGMASFFNVMVFVVGYFVATDTFMRDTHGGDVSRLGGLIMNPNEVGMLCVVAMSAIIAAFFKAGIRGYYIVVLGISFFALILTSSRSSLIAFLLIVAFFVLRSGKAKIIWPSVGVSMLAIPYLVNVVILKEGHVDAEEVMSMTGRIPFWKALMTEALPQEPYFGFGFMCIYYTKYFQGMDTYPASMTHNTFIQVFVSMGMIGFLVVLFQMTTFFNSVMRAKIPGGTNLFVAIFIPIFINSLTEFGIWGITNYGVLYYQILFLYYVIYYNDKLSNDEQRIEWRSRYRKSILAKT